MRWSSISGVPEWVGDPSARTKGFCEAPKVIIKVFQTKDYPEFHPYSMERAPLLSRAT